MEKFDWEQEPTIEEKLAAKQRYWREQGKSEDWLRNHAKAFRLAGNTLGKSNKQQAGN